MSAGPASFFCNRCSLERLPQLKKLDLSGNGLWPKDVTPIFRFAAHPHCKLDDLVLNNNRTGSNKGATSLALRALVDLMKKRPCKVSLRKNNFTSEEKNTWSSVLEAEQFIEIDAEP